MKKQNRKGITLISLIITTIVMLILSAITIHFTIGKNGLFQQTELSTHEHEKAEATETMNLKITSLQIKSYTEKQKLANSQDLADGLCEDEEIEYVLLESKATATLNKITVGNNQSIFTKIKKYPYEFEINAQLQLASIDGVKISNTDTVSKSDYEALLARVETLENDYNTLKQKVDTSTNEKLGKVLWSGSFRSGSITVDGLEDYSYIIAICDLGWAIPLYRSGESGTLYGIGGRGGTPNLGLANRTDRTVMALTLQYNGNVLTYYSGKYMTDNNLINTDLHISKIIGIF